MSGHVCMSACFAVSRHRCPVLTDAVPLKPYVYSGIKHPTRFAIVCPSERSFTPQKHKQLLIVT